MSEDYLWGSNESQLYEMGKRCTFSLIRPQFPHPSKHFEWKNTKVARDSGYLQNRTGKARRRNKEDQFLVGFDLEIYNGGSPCKFYQPARVEIIVSRFIEMFLAEEKMISGDGKVLKQFQKVASKIIKTEVASSSRKEIRELWLLYSFCVILSFPY